MLRKWGFTMNFIQYVKQVWKAKPIGGTPFTPDRFNHIEDGIKNNNDMISELNSNSNAINNVRLQIAVPNPTGKIENAIENCKTICANIEPLRPACVLAINSGYAMYIGYTYQKTNNPNYARFLFINIASNTVVSIWCNNYEWQLKYLNS